MRENFKRLSRATRFFVADRLACFLGSVDDGILGRIRLQSSGDQSCSGNGGSRCEDMSAREVSESDLSVSSQIAKLRLAVDIVYARLGLGASQIWTGAVWDGSAS